MSFFSFPTDFLWGSATSSYQVEGNNQNNDWFLAEAENKIKFSCGIACDSYRRFREDFDIAKSLNHNSHRLSLEWSRIQPEEGHFDPDEINHYRKVLESLKERGIQSIVTLHHFTNPIWFAQKGGWSNKESPLYFDNYVKKVISELGGLSRIWVTINEPLVYVYNSFYQGIWPPGVSSLRQSLKVLDNLKRAHKKAYKSIHSGLSDNVKVGIAKHLRFFSACSYFNLGQNNIPAFLRRKYFNYKILDELHKEKTMDFIGVNYYTGDFLKFDFRDLFGKNCLKAHHKQRKNFLGWYVSPEKMFNLLMDIKKYNLPVLITENGTVETEDKMYADYLRQHLFYLDKAIKSGVKVLGYMWWSLLDNFEWDKGFSPKFGLVSVDENQNRKVKPFAYLYKKICTENKIEV